MLPSQRVQCAPPYQSDAVLKMVEFFRSHGGTMTYSEFKKSGEFERNAYTKAMHSGVLRIQPYRPIMISSNSDYNVCDLFGPLGIPSGRVLYLNDMANVGYRLVRESLEDYAKADRGKRTAFSKLARHCISPDFYSMLRDEFCYSPDPNFPLTPWLSYLDFHHDNELRSRVVSSLASKLQENDVDLILTSENRRTEFASELSKTLERPCVPVGLTYYGPHLNYRVRQAIKSKNVGFVYEMPVVYPRMPVTSVNLLASRIARNSGTVRSKAFTFVMQPDAIIKKSQITTLKVSSFI
jgi:hypothetical protein